MTSANVFNWTAVRSQTLNTNAKASGSKADNKEIASVFASMMNANYSAGANVAGNASARSSWSKPVETSTQASAYDRYQYRENPVETAEATPFADKLAEATEELAGFEEEVTKVVADKLGLTEDQVVQVMEDLGLTAFDLLDPQNLIQLTVALTGAADGTELLVSPQFLDLMQTMHTMGEELMTELDLPVDQMSELIAQMDALETPAELSEDALSELAGQMSESEADVEKTVTDEAQTLIAAESEEAKAAETKPEAEVDKAGANVLAAGREELQEGEESEPEAVELTHIVSKESTEKDAGTSDETGAFADRRETGAKTAREQTTAVNEPVVGAQNVFSEMKEQIVSELSQLDNRYLSIDSVDIMEQVVRNLKVTIMEGVSSMEMTLNPENLGKVYLQISAREGAVHAQIAAANEAVKHVLEAQVAEIQEHLNQAGVKVEAIEVTVASHEFERNLEQNQKREEQEGERAQENRPRRNINLSSLDELSSLMSEEEALVAQIMRDNGNTVDLSA